MVYCFRSGNKVKKRSLGVAHTLLGVRYGESSWEISTYFNEVVDEIWQMIWDDQMVVLGVIWKDEINSLRTKSKDLHYTILKDF